MKVKLSWPSNDLLVRWLYSGVCSFIIMITFSLPIHGILFHHYWETISLIRSTDTWHLVPGASIATFVFCLLLSWGYARLYVGVPGRGLWRGFNYGLILFVIFIPFVELWNYLQLEIPFMVVVAGLLHYIITLPLGGVAMAAIYGSSLEPIDEQARFEAHGHVPC